MARVTALRCITRYPMGPYVNSNCTLQIWAAVKQIWISYVVIIINPFTSKIENVRLVDMSTLTEYSTFSLS